MVNAFDLKLYSFGLNGIEEAGSLMQWVVFLFILLTYLSYFSFITLCAFIIPFLLVKVTTKHWLIISISLISVSCLILFILIDSYLFKIYRFHVNNYLLKMMFNQYRSELVYFSNAEWLFFYLAIVAIFFIEGLFAWLLWFNQRINISNWIHKYLYLSVLLLIVSFCSTVVGSKYLIRLSNMFPYYTDIARHLFAVSKKKMNFMVYSHYYAQSQFASHKLQYPIKPLQCDKNIPSPNLFIILIDTWRFDMINEKISPNIFHFATENLFFHNHFSGGNATQPGVFSIFYSIPGSYWNAILDQKKSPVLINHLIKRNYQFGIFASANLTIPNFAATIFNRIPNLPTPPSGFAYQRDREVTRRFVSFLANRTPNKPIFSFIFYDSVHEYCEPKDYAGPLQPELAVCKRYHFSQNSLPYLNRYKNAVNFVDQQIAQVLAEIKKAKLWDNSIIIISADHGEEFNDNHNGFWGHTSNFSQYQVRVPLIIHWPGKLAQHYSYPTTHYDIVPTVLSGAMNCHTPPLNYSTGINLFRAQDRYPIIVSGNYNVSYLTPSTITNLFPSGEFEVQDLQTKPLLGNIDSKQLTLVLHHLNRFYQFT